MPTEEVNGEMMEYRGYHATVEYDPDDNILIGRVIEIADSINFHAKSTDELVAMFHQSIENYLALCERVGKIPERIDIYADGRNKKPKDISYRR